MITVLHCVSLHPLHDILIFLSHRQIILFPLKTSFKSMSIEIEYDIVYKVNLKIKAKHERILFMKNSRTSVERHGLMPNA
jgi:hypothetical protein